MSVWYGLPTGVAFGFLLNKAGVHRPSVIKDQFYLRDFRMMKTFMSAVTTGLISVTIIKATTDSQLSIKPLYPIATALGGTILGLGMLTSEACPGTTWAQLGVGIARPFWVISGGVFGSMLYGAVQPYLNLSGTQITLFGALDLPFWQVSLALALAMVFGVALLEFRFPTPRSDDDRPLSTRKVWNPYLAGSLIGLLQIPSFLLGSNFLGTSSSFVSLAWITENTTRLSHFFPSSYLDRFAIRSLSDNALWQVLLVSGIAIGSYIANGPRHRSIFSPGPFSIPFPKAARLFFSGAVLLFGARLADGCTSGHGLSGVSQLSVSSMIATASMFLGGFLIPTIRHFLPSKHQNEE